MVKVEQNEIYRVHRLRDSWLVVLAIVFVASTLRAPLTAVGPVINQIKDALAINNSVAGILTTIPLIIFGIVSPFVSKVSAKLTMSKTVLFSTILVMIALVLRVSGGFSLFIVGTILLGVGIAFGNVVLPSYVKWKFPLQIGLMTGLYSGTMNFTAGLGGGLSFPLSQVGGFRFSLVFWFIFAVIALILWIPQMLSGTKQGKEMSKEVAKIEVKKLKISKSKLAWAIAFMMGFQSMIFYTVVAWVPSILVDRGLDQSSAGYLLMLNQFAQVPMTFLFPILASKMKNQKLLITIVSALFIIGFALFFTQSFTLLIIGMILAGFGMGSGFSLCMTFFSIRARTSDGSIALSGFAQSVGYFVAAIGRFFVGLLHDLTGGWASGIVALVIMGVLFYIFGLASSHGEVEDDLA
ncbi:CynX/NimT family MFS transporter [Staphylococcus carnosus]|uniref:Permease n=1 Tax=Staphylococcus carnosus TaxID=1281 RepID=A0AAJ0JPW4_STACA|nr:MFS transporter [Staphylococcus carnosus]KKB25839.1 permease [Staphylococcus carnosus]POA06504.1 MFS transporter [Staphylococcus carnosus]QQS84363.1 MFS transporter [Staphylococcus carnosus]QRQ04303.1 MFS transporter [Staphylococcus carnosus]UTB83695.1 permease [Staphylococcus carnosus]